MKSGRYIGVMSGTSLDGVDVVLAAIDENMVAQQASLTWPIPISLKEDILSICQGQQLTLSQLGQLDVRLGALFADAVQALMNPSAMPRTPCKSAITTRLWRKRVSRWSAISVVAILLLADRAHRWCPRFIRRCWRTLQNGVWCSTLVGSPICRCLFRGSRSAATIPARAIC